MPSRQEILYQLNSLPPVTPTEEEDPNQMWIGDENDVHFRVTKISSSEPPLLGLVISGARVDSVIDDFKQALGDPIFATETTVLWQPTPEQTKVDLDKIARPFRAEINLYKSGPSLIVNSEVAVNRIVQRQVMFAATRIWAFNRKSMRRPSIYQPSRFPRESDLKRVGHFTHDFGGNKGYSGLFVGLDYAFSFLDSDRNRVGIAIESAKPLNIRESTSKNAKTALRRIHPQ